MTVTKTPTYYAILEACAYEGCPVCRIVQNGLEGHLKSFFYESVNDVERRARLRQSLGYCREHLRLMLDAHIGDPLGFSILYQDILTQLLRGLAASGDVAAGQGLADQLRFSLRQASGGKAKQVGSIETALAPAAACPACQEQAAFTELVLKTLAQTLRDEQMTQALSDSQGLCLPHLRQALPMAGDARAHQRLVQLSQQSLTNLRDQLAEFIRKNDYRFANEPVGEEGNAWRRALNLVTGEIVND
jgi:hypothetical protein